MNMRFYILMFTIVCSFLAQATDTYYYKLVKIVDNGKETTNVTGGQFISFVTNSVCYESDRKGKGIGHGELKMKESYKGYISFYGLSYWGDATFIFKNDFSVLNVNTDKIKAVYKRTQAPPSAYTCSLIRSHNHNNELPPHSIDPIHSSSSHYSSCNSETYNNSGNSNSRHRNNVSDNKHQRKICSYVGVNDKRHCGGDGKCSQCGGDGLMNGFGINNVKCSLCNGSGKCVSCNGSGYLK